MKLRSVMAGLAVAGAIPCMAVTNNASVVITGFKNGAQLATIVNANKIVGTYYAGEFVGSLNGNAFSTFCTDIYESFGWNNSNNPYTHELKFRLDGGWSGTVEARNQANTWLKSLSTASEGYSVQSLYSGSAHGNRQDFLVATPVPEPQTYALALVSLGIIAGYARRKREQP
jgi:hypothetical protein